MTRVDGAGGPPGGSSLLPEEGASDKNVGDKTKNVVRVGETDVSLSSKTTKAGRSNISTAQSHWNGHGKVAKHAAAHTAAAITSGREKEVMTIIDVIRTASPKDLIGVGGAFLDALDNMKLEPKEELRILKAALQRCR